MAGRSTESLDLRKADVAAYISVYILCICPSSTTQSRLRPNLKKHGVSFADAEGALFDPLALTVEDIGAVGERRFVTLGLGSAGELLIVVYTYRDNEPRLISARRPTRKERNTYEG